VGEENGIRLDGDVLHLAITTKKVNGTKAYARLREILSLSHTVLQNDNGQLLVFDPDRRFKETSRYYLGNEEVVHRLRRGDNAQRVWHPRGRTSMLKSKDGYTAKCMSGHTVEFKPVSDEKRLRVLANLKFETELWKRRAFALARDDRGVYYYVDRLSDEKGGKNFRVFKGPRGEVRETKLVDIVDDSSSMIFATKKGKLRFLVNKQDDYKNVTGEDAVWMEGKKRIPLALVPIDDNLELIYYGLGAYDGEDFGWICD
jgi:hypothetical protein